jgi:hypothetical protein
MNSNRQRTSENNYNILRGSFKDKSGPPSGRNSIKGTKKVGLEGSKQNGKKKNEDYQ